MHRLAGHALLLLGGATGAVLCLAWLSPSAPKLAGHVGASPAPIAADAPALRPLPASAAQHKYARAAATQAERQVLAAAVQRELQRVGCYRGAIDGTWGTGSRQAVAAFGRAVNVPFASDAPDEALLRLLEGQPRRLCGAGPDTLLEARLPERPTFAEPRLISEPVEVPRPQGRHRVPPAPEPATSALAPTARPAPAPTARADVTTAPRPAEKPRAEKAGPQPPAFVREIARSVSNVLAPLGW